MPENGAPASEHEFSVLANQVRGLPVVKVYGEVDLATVPRLREAISDALGASTREADGHPGALILDFSETRFFDSSGLGLLIEQRKKLEPLGTQLGLVVGEGPVLRLLRTTGMDSTAYLYADADTAARNLGNA